MLLGEGSGVGRATVFVEPTLVADADAVGVVTLGMRAYHLLRTTRIDGAILGDVVMIADGAETLCLVAGFERLNGEVAVGSRGRAMDDDKIYISHVDWDSFLLGFTGLNTKGGGDGREDGDEELDDFLPIFFFHVISDFF